MLCRRHAKRCDLSEFVHAAPSPPSDLQTLHIYFERLTEFLNQKKMRSSICSLVFLILVVFMIEGD